MDASTLASQIHEWFEEGTAAVPTTVRWTVPRACHGTARRRRTDRPVRRNGADSADCAGQKRPRDHPEWGKSTARGRSRARGVGHMQTPAAFEYQRATSVDHAVQLLGELGPEARLI